ncbi:hypothetical protein AAV94_07085 [Lampropedia cohaerens]|uniref:Lipopolysaccharide assembly protein A domain-containing protein n=1 Tax=Lampropedia cohaerens TaxID=1610491 RepID=A0A0U1PZN0_9BURK|nr:LapA family protein [Lampropedia cohaerens]KKW67936.1 hypothetical protein AAV94_07085 [Lampropedia cohaerens]
MKYLIWLLRAAFFFVLFAFSLNNQHHVTVHWFFGMQWQGPLVLAMLVAFALGLALGLATVIPRWRRLRQREQAFGAQFQSSTTSQSEQGE